MTANALFRGFLARFPFALLCLAIIPNIIFYTASENYGLGRSVFNIDYIILAVIALNLPRLAVIILYLILLVLDVAYMVAPVYHFQPTAFLSQFSAIANLHWGGAVFPRAALFAVGVAFCVGFLAIARFKKSHKLPKMLVMAFLGVCVVSADAVNGSFHFDPLDSVFHRDLLRADMNYSSSPSWKLIRTQIYPLPADSTVGEKISGQGSGNPASALSKAIGDGGLSGLRGNTNNIVLIIVESWGKLLDPAIERIAVQPLASPDIQRRYTVEKGVIPFNGSTTNAEMRELCESYLKYTRVSKKFGVDCMPSKFQSLGFETIATHGFSGSMFEREVWWRKIGFNKTMFVRDFNAAGLTAQCGTTFRGACDSEQIKYDFQLLRIGNSRKFIYNLTLNSHLPIASATVAQAGLQRPTNMSDVVFSLISSWHLVFSAVHDLAVHPDISSTMFVIVGDHAPPIWSKVDVNLFSRENVPYIILRPN